MKNYLLIVLILTVSVTALGCGGEKNWEDVPPEDACMDLADAFGRLCTRCNIATYDECNTEFLRMANFCQGVKIRDINSLYNSCIPWFESVNCEYVFSESFDLDPSCKSQLLQW